MALWAPMAKLGGTEPGKSVQMDQFQKCRNGQFPKCRNGQSLKCRNGQSAEMDNYFWSISSSATWSKSMIPCPRAEKRPATPLGGDAGAAGGPSRGLWRTVEAKESLLVESCIFLRAAGLLRDHCCFPFLILYSARKKRNAIIFARKSI